MAERKKPEGTPNPWQVSEPEQKVVAPLRHPLEETEFGPRDTPESKEFADFSAVTHKVGEKVRDRRPAGTNLMSLSEQSRRRYGIRPDEEIAWPVDTMTGPLAGIMPHDNVQTVIESVPGARVVKDPETGRPVRVGEHVLVAYSKEAAEDYEREVRARAEELQRLGREHGLPGDRYHDMSSEEEVRKWVIENQERLASLNVGSRVGSPTAGLDLRVVLQSMSKEEVEQEMYRYRQGGHRPNIAEFEASSKDEEEGRERQARRTGKRRYWSGWRP